MTRTPPPKLWPHALQVAVLNTVIALSLTAFGSHPLAENLVYSQSIGLSIWALIECCVHWAVHDWETQWRRMVLLVPLCVVAGYLLGTALGDALLQQDSLALWQANPRKTLGLLAMSLGAGALGTYHYLSRGQLAAARERALSAQRQAAEARLKLLETQLEPHMLFNTLANLRVLIGSDPARAQAMLDRLIDYLRATLAASRSGTHALATEFDRLRDYLELMQVRMGPRLRYTLTLPDALRGHAIPPLLLQPLVENAIQHGLEPSVAGGEVQVQASLQHGALQLVVTDTGVGMAAAPVLSPTRSGFGLGQVRERLLTAYGAQAHMAVTTHPPHGTRIVLTLPGFTPA